MSSSSDPPQHLRDQAIAWLVRLHADDCSEQERHAFERWLQENSEHREIYAKELALWNSIEPLRERLQPALESARQAPKPERLRSVGFVGLILLAALGGWQWQQLTFDTYETAMGEQRLITLEDGSRMVLNTATRVRVKLGPKAREVRLDAGEAVFYVNHDPARPFAVKVDDLSIRDIGTRFDVYRRPEAVQITVMEGEIELDDSRHLRGRRLPGGFQQRVGIDGRVEPPQRVDTAQVATWEHGRLNFNNTPLGEVTAELSRYHPVEFRFADSSLEHRTLSGTFATTDLEPFLQAVEKVLHLRITRPTGKQILLSRIDPNRSAPSPKDNTSHP